MKLFVKTISLTILFAFICTTVVQSIANVQIVEIIEDEVDSGEDETSLEIDDLFAYAHNGTALLESLADEKSHFRFLISMHSQQYHHKIPCPPPEFQVTTD